LVQRQLEVHGGAGGGRPWCRTGCRRARSGRDTRSPSDSGTGSPSPGWRASTGMGFPRVNSSWGIRTTTGSSRQAPSYPMGWIPDEILPLSENPTTRPGTSGTWVGTAATSSTGSWRRTWPASGASWSGRRTVGVGDGPDPCPPYRLPLCGPLARWGAAGTCSPRGRPLAFGRRRLRLRGRPGRASVSSRGTRSTDQPPGRDPPVRPRGLPPDVPGPPPPPERPDLRSAPLRSRTPSGPLSRGGPLLRELEDDGEPRGLHFLSVEAGIASQFEFVQQAWCNNPRFNGLHDNPDPLIGRMPGPTDPPGTPPLPVERVTHPES
jgi:hypothetical protein